MELLLTVFVQCKMRLPDMSGDIIAVESLASYLCSRIARGLLTSMKMVISAMKGSIKSNKGMPSYLLFITETAASCPSFGQHACMHAINAIKRVCETHFSFIQPWVGRVQNDIGNG